MVSKCIKIAKLRLKCRSNAKTNYKCNQTAIESNCNQGTKVQTIQKSVRYSNATIISLQQIRAI